MKKPLALAIVFLLLTAFSAGAANSLHHKHAAPTQQKGKPAEPAPAATPPVTRLPIAPDTFRA